MHGAECGVVYGFDRWQTEPALKKIAPGWQGLALAPSGGSVTRHRYHCRGQPGSAHGKPGAVGRQNPALAPGALLCLQARGRYRKKLTRGCGTERSTAMLVLRLSTMRPLNENG